MFKAQQEAQLHALRDWGETLRRELEQIRENPSQSGSSRGASINIPPPPAAFLARPPSRDGGGAARGADGAPAHGHTPIYQGEARTKKGTTVLLDSKGNKAVVNGYPKHKKTQAQQQYTYFVKEVGVQHDDPISLGKVKVLEQVGLQTTSSVFSSSRSDFMFLCVWW